MARPWTLAGEARRQSRVSVAAGDAGGDGPPSHLVHTQQRVCRSRGSAAASTAGPAELQGPRARAQGAWAGRPCCRHTSMPTAVCQGRILFQILRPSSAGSALHASGAGTGGTNFQLRRNGDTR